MAFKSYKSARNLQRARTADQDYATRNLDLRGGKQGVELAEIERHNRSIGQDRPTNLANHQARIRAELGGLLDQPAGWGTFTCETCGRVKTVPPNKLAMRKYCTRACAARGKRHKRVAYVVFECPICHAVSWLVPSKAAVRQTCSRACTVEWRRRKRKKRMSFAEGK